MTIHVTPLLLPLPFKIGGVYSYLLRTENGFILIDTGMTNARHQLDTALTHFCTQPGDLRLIILTHGDFDHTGNARYIRDKYHSQIAMHQADADMLERGDMFWNRKIQGSLVKKLVHLFVHFGESERCTPDVLLSDGDSLASYGLDAQVLSTPGHSSGSICILTDDGDLFCGDLLSNNRRKPMLNPIMYDKAAGDASFSRLQNYSIKKVYPGHGTPFAWEALLQG